MNVQVSHEEFAIDMLVAASGWVGKPSHGAMNCLREFPVRRSLFHEPSFAILQFH